MSVIKKQNNYLSLNNSAAMLRLDSRRINNYINECSQINRIKKMKKGEKTKNLILSTSLQLFSENGYSGTSVRNISSAVGLRESAIYNHFKSKQDLLCEIVSKFGQSSTGINLLTDELIEKLSSPLNFMKLFSKELLKNWSEKDEILFFKLVLKRKRKRD